jgi:hypothetical protein
MNDRARRKRKLPFTQIDDTVIDNYPLSGNAVLVYLALCRFADNETAECYPSLETIGKVARIKSKTTVIAALDELIEFDYIDRKQQFTANGKKQSNLYTLKTEYIVKESSDESCPDCKDTGLIKNKSGDFIRYCSCAVGRKRNALNSTR